MISLLQPGSGKMTPKSPHARAARSLRRCRALPAFTLVEMLVVIGIIGILIVVAAPSISGALEASKLTSVGSNLTYKISLAQQEAVSTRTPVELRLFSYNYDGTIACRASQLFAYKSATVGALPTPVAIENPTFFGDGSVVARVGTLSPLLSGATTTAVEEPLASKGATYHKIIFYPDGSTNLTSTLRNSYLTLVGERVDQTLNPPPNYYTVQVDPVTGRARAYRP